MNQINFSIIITTYHFIFLKFLKEHSNKLSHLPFYINPVKKISDPCYRLGKNVQWGDRLSCLRAYKTICNRNVS